MFSTLWQRLSYLGLEGDNEFSEKREVILMNRVMFITMILILPMIVVSLVIGEIDAAIRFTVQNILAGICIWFNSKKWFALAKAYLFAICLVIIFSSSVLMGKEYPNEFILLIIIPLILILFKNKTLIYTLSAVTVGCFFLIIYLKNIIPPVIFIAPENKIFIEPFVFFLLFAVIFFEVYYFATLNRQYENQLIDQKKELQQKQEDIFQSINYSKHLQNALLPPHSLVKSVLPNSFVLFLPKDIVSGDFYWLQQNDDKILVAVGDCTGHGVPGAMVSLLAINSLSRCVREFNLSNPADILDKANQLFVENFGTNSSSINDGMDVSIVSIPMNFSNQNEIKINWAGANNPLWIIAAEQKSEIFEIKPDKQPIGKFDKQVSFTSHEVVLKRGDKMYMFSDGYPDQFGGDKGKKFSKAQFKKLLLHSSEFSMKDQKNELEVNFNKWKGSLEQLDDVCVFGIEV
jgi:hypothetical protein